MLRMTGIAFLIAMVLAESGCGGGSSFTPPPPPPSTTPSISSPGSPSISSISPTSAAPGSPDLTLTITGSNFAGTTHNVRRAVWSANGANTKLATTFVSSTQLTTLIPATLLSNVVTAHLFIEYGDPMGDVPLSKSNSVSFSVTNPSPGSPSISSIAPSSATAGSPDVTLTITGSSFANERFQTSIAGWSTNPSDPHCCNTWLNTTFLSSTQLTAVIPAAVLQSPVTAQVFVETGDPQGISDGVSYPRSNSISFSVNAAAPTTSAVSPTLVTLGPKGTQQFAASLNGNNADATWEVEEGAAGGSITATGLYTVPAHVGTFHVIATFVADPSKNAAATVTAVASGFSETGSMSTPRSGHTATLLADGKVLIVGGPDATAELFDPATATFSLTGSMTTPRHGATATLLANGKVLITGGFGPGTSSLPRLNSAELYDPLTGTFSATGSMADPRVLHTATLMNDGKVLIAGGTREGGGGGAALASAEMYDPTTGTFAVTGSMLSDRAQHTATLLASGEILIVGGWNGHAADSLDDPPWDPLFAELFEPSSSSFEASGSMSTTRIGHSAIRLANGKVLVLGGVPSLQNIHEQPPDPRYAELYDPTMHIFASLGNLTMSRNGYTATLLTGGRVLLAGGENLGLTVDTAELFDAASGSLTNTGRLVTGRKGHSAALLKDGRVLVTGGTDNNGNALAMSELYE